MGNKKLIFIFVLILSLLITQNAQLEVYTLPNSNIETVASHQKELIGRHRTPQSLKGNNKADQIVSNLILEITNKNLPKKFKKDSVKIASAIVDEANRYGMDPLFLASIITQESRFNPHAIGGVGEIGLMQIRPTTAEWLNKKYKIVPRLNLKNPVTNIKIGAFYLNKLRNKFDQNSRWYISAYNMGSNRLKRKLKENKKPKEYVQNVMRHYLQYIAELNSAFKKADEELQVFETNSQRIASN